MIRTLDRILAALVSAGRWLVIPVVLLLFTQWPLREVVQAGSREANDFGQWLFALLVGLSLVAATRAGTHLTPGGFAARYPARVRRVMAAALPALVLIPWAGFVLVAGWPGVAASVGMAERFPETANPGYFVVKAAVLLLAGTVLLQGIVSTARALRR